jgi:hypothetical protein
VVRAVNQPGSGGGLNLDSGTASDDTIADNAVIDGSGNPTGVGGGVWSVGAAVGHDTIVGNSAASGGGLGGKFTADASIIVGNIGGGCAGTITSVTVNLNPDGSCGSSGTVLTGNPQLGALADNGGPSLTMAIPSSSPAYDATTECAGTDQRGFSLLQRGASRCDLGAYQVNAPTTYVANTPANSVTAYATGANGNVAPVLDITGSATGLNGPKGVVTDARGDVFVANAAGNSIIEYAPEVTGNVAPVATIAGTTTQLGAPQDLALDASGHLFASNKWVRIDHRVRRGCERSRGADRSDRGSKDAAQLSPRADHRPGRASAREQPQRYHHHLCGGRDGQRRSHQPDHQSHALQSRGTERRSRG